MSMRGEGPEFTGFSKLRQFDFDQKKGQTMSDGPMPQTLGLAQVKPSPAARLEDVLRAIGVQVLPGGTPVLAAHDRETLEFAIATLSEHVQDGSLRGDDVATAESYIAALEGNLELMRSVPPARPDGTPNLEPPSEAEVGTLVDSLDSTFNPTPSAIAGTTQPKPGKTQGVTPMTTTTSKKDPTKKRTKAAADAKEKAEAEAKAKKAKADKKRKDDKKAAAAKNAQPTAAPVAHEPPAAATKSLMPKGLISLVAQRGPAATPATTRDHASIGTANKAAALHVLQIPAQPKPSPTDEAVNSSDADDDELDNRLNDDLDDADEGDNGETAEELERLADEAEKRQAEESARQAAELALEAEKQREEKDLARSLGELEDPKKAETLAEESVRALAPTDVHPSLDAVPSIEINIDTPNSQDGVPTGLVPSRPVTPAGGYTPDERKAKIAAAGAFSSPPPPMEAANESKGKPTESMDAVQTPRKPRRAKAILAAAALFIFLMAWWQSSQQPRSSVVAPTKAVPICEIVTAKNLMTYLGQKDPTQYVRVGGEPVTGEAYLDASEIDVKPLGTRTIYDVTGAKICWRVSGFAFFNESPTCIDVNSRTLKDRLGQKDPTKYVSSEGGGEPKVGEAYLDATGGFAKPSGTRTVYDVTGAKVCHF